MQIEKMLDDAQVPYKKRQHPTAYTAQELAAEEHVSGDAVAKTVLVKAGDRLVMCVLPASFKIDLGKLAIILSVDQCRLAEEDELATVFRDVELGAEPPFGHPYGLETLVDRHLARYDNVVFQAGSHREAIQMRFDDYCRLAQPRMEDFSIHL